MFAALHPNAPHAVVCTAGQWPWPSQLAPRVAVACFVLVSTVQLAVRQLFVEPG
jgi:hypothetical protein